jgi:ParB family chromosome partitioning protein
MTRKRGLGSGLDALLPSRSTDAPQAVRMLPIEAVRENRSQPRTHFDDHALDELAASIREHGLIQPIIVTEDASGGYELIAGERRLRASRRAGLETVPALIKQATPQQLLELAIVENVQRADLNPLEEGLAYQTLKDEFGLTDETIAQRVGKSRVAVVNTRRLIRLSAEARQALLDGVLSAGHGRVLLRFDAADEQAALLRLLLDQDWTVRETERFAELALHPHLASPVRQALLAGTLRQAQAYALLQLSSPDQQIDFLPHVQQSDLDEVQITQLQHLTQRGLALDAALHALLHAPASTPSLTTSTSTPLGASERMDAPSPVTQPGAYASDDAEAQRLFETLLATPVKIVRHGKQIRLIVTFYHDEQLQSLYDRLSQGEQLLDQEG